MAESGVVKTAHSFKRVRAPNVAPGVVTLLFRQELIAGRHNLEACIEQPPKNDPGRRTRIHDDDRKICGSEQVFEHLLRGELAHAAPCFATSAARCQSSPRVSWMHSSCSMRVSATPKIPSLSSGGMFSPDDMMSSAFARLQAWRIGVSSSFSPLATSRIFVLAFFMTAPP